MEFIEKEAKEAPDRGVTSFLFVFIPKGGLHEALYAGVPAIVMHLTVVK